MLQPLSPRQFPLVASNGTAVDEFYKFLLAVAAALKVNKPNIQTASYVLVMQDAGGIVEMNVGAGNNLTVPPSTAVSFDIGTTIQINQVGAGQTTLVAGAGVTLDHRVGLKLIAQYAVAFVVKRGTDEWLAYGDLSA